jgi:Ca2+-binding EF-hand superfamily protein
MIGSNARQPIESAEVRAKSIFSQMDKNKDGGLTEEEFLQGCLLDHELSKALVPQ